jgi:hypothetical protein
MRGDTRRFGTALFFASFAVLPYSETSIVTLAVGLILLGPDAAHRPDAATPGGHSPAAARDLTRTPDWFRSS